MTIVPQECEAPGFFDKAFEGFEPPAAVRELSVIFCRRYHVTGKCDPMYIANLSAYELRMGDGCGNFADVCEAACDTVVDKLACRLMHTYWSCIKTVDPHTRADDIAALIRSTVPVRH